MDHAQFALVSLLIPVLVGAGILDAWRSRFWRGSPRDDAAALIGCFLLALLVRMSARAFPADFILASPQGVGIGFGHRWAPGYGAILHFLYLFSPSNVASAAKLNVVIGALTAPIIFAFVDAYFKDRLAAFAAAAVFACQPVLVRYAASDSAHVLLTFCLFAGCLFLSLWSNDGRRRWLLQGAGWLALAANVRAEGVSYILVGGFILAGAAPRMTGETKAQLRQAGWLCLLILVYPLLQVYDGIAARHADTFDPLGFAGGFFLSRHSSTVIVALALLGVLGAGLTGFRRTSAYFLALVVVSLPTGFRVSVEESHRQVLPHLAAWCVFAGHGFSAALRLLSWLFARAAAGKGAASRRLPTLAAAAVLVTVLWSAAPHRAYLSKTWTYVLEYEFIVSHLGDIPDGCVIVWPGIDNQARGLNMQHISAEVGRQHDWVPAGKYRSDPGGSCVVFYRAGGCFSWEAIRYQRQQWTGKERPICRSVGERFHLEPIATASLPAIPYEQEAFTVNPIPVGFYRLSARE